MPKFVAPTLSADRASIAVLQSTFNDLQALLDTFLSRDGTLPNQMGADLDMNSYKILNMSHQFKIVTNPQLLDINNSVNTANKAEGVALYDTTNKRLMIASGSGAGDSWFDTMGTNEVAPQV